LLPLVQRHGTRFGIFAISGCCKTKHQPSPYSTLTCTSVYRLAL
jgi:hypothetical protein